MRTENRLQSTRNAKVVQLIQTESCVGLGTEEDPIRVVFQYWDFEGRLMAERDTITGGQTEHISR